MRACSSNAVTADVHGSNRAKESRVALILLVGREFVFGGARQETPIAGMGGLAASGFSVGGFEESLLLDYVSAPVCMVVGMVNSAFGGRSGPFSVPQ